MWYIWVFQLKSHNLDTMLRLMPEATALVCSTFSCLGLLQLCLQCLRISCYGLCKLLRRLFFWAAEPLQKAGARVVIFLVLVNHIFKVVAKQIALKQRKSNWKADMTGYSGSIHKGNDDQEVTIQCFLRWWRLMLPPSGKNKTLQPLMITFQLQTEYLWM